MLSYVMICNIRQKRYMEIVITEWALQSYLDLKSVFTKKEYFEILRPDAELLESYPHHPKFKNDKFWDPAKTKAVRSSAMGIR